MKTVKVMMSLLLLLTVPGCWGSKETDEIAYVLVMGFDKGPAGNIIATFQVANPKAIAGQTGAGGGGGGGGGGQKPYITASVIAPLPIAAFNLMNVERSRHISLLHTEAFIFSDELAREGLKQHLNALNRFRETRGTAFIFISRGKAKDFIEKNKPKLEITPAKEFELVSRINKLHSLSPVVQLQEFYGNSKRIDTEPVAPLVGISKVGLDQAKPVETDTQGKYLAGDMPTDKGEFQFLGSAVFKGDKMVGELTGDETRYYNMLTGKMAYTFLVVKDPLQENNIVGLQLMQARKPNIKVKYSGEHPSISVELFIEPEIVGIPSGINYESEKDKGILEKELAGIINDRCRQLVSRTQEEFRSDIFGFGRYARKDFLTVKEWRKANWPEVYPSASVDINVHLKIRRTGMMLKTSPAQ